MSEEEFLARWSAERPMYEAWGGYVVERTMELLRPELNMAVDLFVRIPVSPRVKENNSLIGKAFYRSKAYENPYDAITDKVGVRFVVLLASDIEKVERAINVCDDWKASKDRDYLAELADNPYEFQYQSVHYVVRSTSAIKIRDIEIETGTPCEVQIRTLLQHAHSELTHDTIYKPTVKTTASMRRAAAKSMALIEATNDYFEDVFREIEDATSSARTISAQLTELYHEATGIHSTPAPVNGVVIGALEEISGDEAIQELNTLLAGKAFIADAIKRRAPTNLLFRQPSILLTYLCVEKSPAKTQEIWPLTLDELRPIFADLGRAFD
jgi:putative GTP pyrophosphokinase